MTTRDKAQKKFPVAAVIFALVAVALIAVVVLTFASDESGEFGSPTVTGQPLLLLPDGVQDPAIGTPAPEVTGADFDGTPVEITNDGNAKIIIFVAHWCPHCQNEVPVVQAWLDGGPLPEGIDFYSVATSSSATRPNFPPSAWLKREGWTAPVIVDDEINTVGSSFGLTAFPFWVFVAPDGTVAARVTGEVTPDVLDTAVASLAAQLGG